MANFITWILCYERKYAMNPLNPLFAIIVMTIAYITGYFLNQKIKNSHSKSRFETIDGLRGFLALAVFIHHSTVWFQFIEEGNWRLPDSNLYIHFGETSVALFFMITSFLFVTKLNHIKENEFNWKVFFISRFFRLAPMYYFSILLIFICVFQISNWSINTNLFTFTKSLFNWLTFTIIGRPDINNCVFTDKINAGVTWTLTYEWLFYFSLPIISFFISYKKPKVIFLIISVLFIIFFTLHNIIQPYHIYAFIGGAIAPFLLKFDFINTKIKNNIASIIVIICFLIIRQFSSAKNEYCILLTSIAFTLIALGATLFGLLKTSTLKFLGDISYSTYLLHGIILFIIFHFIVSMENIKLFAPSEFSVLIFAITPIIVIISYFCHRFIEKPFITANRAYTSKVK